MKRFSKAMMKCKRNIFRFYKIPSRLIFKWMVSYFSVLLIPLLIFSYYYAHTYQVIKDKTVVSQRLLLENIREQLDNSVNELNKLSTTLQLNDYVTSISYQDGTASSFHMDRYYLQEDLSLLMVTNSLIEQIYLYFPNSGYVINSTSSYQKDLSDYLPSHYPSEAVWDSLYLNLTRSSYQLLRTADRNNLLYARALIINNKTQKPNAILAIQLNQAKLQNMLASQLRSGNFSALTIISRGNVILSTAPGLILQLDFNDYTEEELTDGPVNVTLTDASDDGGDYVLDSVDLKVPDTRILSFTEKSVYNSTSYQLLTILLISLVTCIVVGIFVTYYFSFYNYRPINEIMGYVNQYPYASGETNEYNKIKQMITASNDEIKRQRLLLKNDYIHKLLTGEVQLSQVSDTVAEQFQLDFPSNCSYVVLLRYYLTDDTDQLLLSGEPEHYPDQFLFFITQNILTELLIPAFPKLYFCYAGNETGLIINVPDTVAGAEELIINGLHSFIDFCRFHYKINHYVGISSLLSGQDLSIAYTQANNALEYLRLFHGGEVCRYSDTPSESRIGYLNLRNSDYIINLVLTANRQGLKDYFAAARHDLAKVRLSTADAKSCLYFYYNISMRLKVQFQQLYSYYSYHSQEAIDFIDSRFFDYSFADAIQTVENLFLQLCLYIKDQKNVGSNAKTAEAARYIESNYFDINLNLNNIAEHFRLTPSYLSRKFKEDYGVSVIDYLYEIRIRHSLVLISNYSLKISDIAQMLGFQDSNAFIRIFKQYQGCTPGKYRSMHEEEL